MRRIRITTCYDGTEYFGWQVQPGLPTIQAVMERAISEIEASPVKVASSGRTDAGVHALAQVAAFSIANPIPVGNLKKALNRLLPRDVRVTDVAEVDAAFHPRYDAVAKTYEYRIWRGELCTPFERLYVHHFPYTLDEEVMIQCAPVIEGEHDFRAFAAADERYDRGDPLVRRVFSSKVARDGEKLLYRVRGSGFLKHMVRNIVGVLLECGKGNLGAEDVRKRLEPRCGIPAGPTAPAQGLFLLGVEY